MATGEIGLPTHPLPPYGLLDADSKGELDAGPEVPPHWPAKAGASAGARKADWERWREETLDLIADVLWPRYNANTRLWEGASAAWMHDLTHTDLALLHELQNRPGPLELDTLPNSPVRAPDCPSHRTFFVVEDQQQNDPKLRIGQNYNFYDRTLPADFVSAVNTFWWWGVDNKVGTSSYQFKIALQRPRPFQTALLYGFLSFSHELAITSMTPSIQCGHCLQGLIGVGGMMERIVIDNIPFTQESWKALQQWGVDIGDRRVMAGVHYPSDNLASWIIVMRLSDHVFPTGYVKKKLWSAITGCSFVYKALRRWIEQGKGKCYLRALDELEKAAREPGEEDPGYGVARRID